MVRNGRGSVNMVMNRILQVSPAGIGVYMMWHARTVRQPVHRKWSLEDRTSLLIITHITHSYTYYAPLRAITHYCVMMCNEGEDEMWRTWHFLLNWRYQHQGSIGKRSETQALAQRPNQSAERVVRSLAAITHCNSNYSWLLIITHATHCYASLRTILLIMH